MTTPNKLNNLSGFLKEIYEAGKINKVLNYDLSNEFKIGNKILGKDLAFIAGPCSVENKEMIISSAKAVKLAGCDALRAGAYKPCTYPVNKDVDGWKEGMREKGLDLLKIAKEESGLEIVSEVMNPSQLELCHDSIDIIQVGTRNFQNYSLLDELSLQEKPVILKRGTWATLEEILGALERLLNGKLKKVAICLRGVIGAPPYRHIFKSSRWQPDLMMIQAIKEVCDIPVIYDPSHATGKRSFVKGIAISAVICGADGLIIEAHPNPPKSISDPDQAISFSELEGIVNKSFNARSIYLSN
jgi:3-deoxy-7-phosphoheptulonate synthase